MLLAVREHILPMIGFLFPQSQAQDRNPLVSNRKVAQTDVRQPSRIPCRQREAYSHRRGLPPSARSLRHCIRRIFGPPCDSPAEYGLWVPQGTGTGS